jgi:hypothetical protein
MRRSKTPQEKKGLSYKKDRRNTYGESPHGSRKSIPQNKQIRNRADRHIQEQALPSFPVPADPEIGDQIESTLRRKRPASWKKVPDRPLGEVVPPDMEYRIQKQKGANLERQIPQKRTSPTVRPADPTLFRKQMKELASHVEPFLTEIRQAAKKASQGHTKPMLKIFRAMRKVRKSMEESQAAPKSLAKLLGGIKKKES